MDFLYFAYIGFLKAESFFEFFVIGLINFLAWFATLFLVMVVLVGIEKSTTDDYQTTTEVVEVKLVPKHTELVGKVRRTVPDTWFVKLAEKGVVCDSTLNIFSVGDKVRLEYSGDGIVFGDTYCKTIQKID